MPVTFTRFAETIHCKEDKRVVSVTVKLLLGDCTGTVYFTDIVFSREEVGFELKCGITLKERLVN